MKNFKAIPIGIISNLGDKKPIAVLGERGSGKTLMALRLAVRMAASSRIPTIIYTDARPINGSLENDLEVVSRELYGDLYADVLGLDVEIKEFSKTGPILNNEQRLCIYIYDGLGLGLDGSIGSVVDYLRNMRGILAHENTAVIAEVSTYSHSPAHVGRRTLWDHDFGDIFVTDMKDGVPDCTLLQRPSQPQMVQAGFREDLATAVCMKLSDENDRMGNPPLSAEYWAIQYKLILGTIDEVLREQITPASLR